MAFKKNSVTTSTYTKANFLPKNLAKQFSKAANVYFLFMMILQLVPGVSLTNGQPTILVPLMFVIMVSAVKDIFEDMKRHASDNVENSKKVLSANQKVKRFTQD